MYCISFANNGDQVYQPCGSINYSTIGSIDMIFWVIRQCAMTSSSDRKRIYSMSCPSLVVSKVLIGDEDLIDKLRRLESEIENTRVEIQALYDELEPLVYAKDTTSSGYGWLLHVAIVILIIIGTLFR